MRGHTKGCNSKRGPQYPCDCARPEYVTLRIPKSRAEKMPRETKELALTRTEFLLAHVRHRPITDLLADAWLQGVNDCASASGILK